MSTELDTKVRKLFDIVKAKREQIAELERPNYKTNLSFQFPTGEQKNLRTIKDINELIIIYAMLKELKDSFHNAAEEIGVDVGTVEQQGFPVQDWMDDVKTLVKVLNIKKEKEDLKKKEDKLNQLISPEEKRRLEIEELEKQLSE